MKIEEVVEFDEGWLRGRERDEMRSVARTIAKKNISVPRRSNNQTAHELPAAVVVTVFVTHREHSESFNNGLWTINSSNWCLKF
jgi:hypothetical protein